MRWHPTAAIQAHDAQIAASGITFPRVPAATFHLDRGLHLIPAIDHIGLSDPDMRQAGPWVIRWSALVRMRCG